MMRLLLSCAAFLLAGAIHGAWAQGQDEEKKAQAKLNIGTLAGLPRPEGFVIEDLRAGMTKFASYYEISRRSSVRGPLIKYKRTIGEAELNVAPMDLLAERLIERYGDKLKGKKLVVREFSLAAYGEGYQPPTVIAVPLSSGAVGAAVVGTLIGNVLLRSMATARTTNLHVTVDAELDGKEFSALEIGSLPVENPDARVLKIMDDFFNFAFYRFESTSSLESAKPAAPSE